MKPYTLKRDILYYAIQGKLVLQDSSEGTGLELIIENNQKKANLSPDLQKRVGKGCKAIQESELPFDIPETWAWERFGNLVINFDSQRRPVTKSDRKTTKGLYDYYGATGVIDKVDEYIFDGEYLMIGEDGGNFFVDRDNSFIAKGTFWANNHVHVVQPIHCNIEYLKVCLDAYDLPNLGLINGIAVPKLNQENMNSILVPLPPLAEQERIVAKIEELLPLIERYEKAWSRLEDFNKRFPGDMQKSILQMAIQGKLVEQRPEEGTGEELYRQIQAEKQALIKAGKIKAEKPFDPITDDERPFDIPSNWTWVRFGELGSYKKGPFGSALTKSMFVPKGPNSVKVYEQKNAIQKDASLGEYYIRRDYFESKMSGFEVHPGDVIVSCAGTIGETYVLPDGIEQGIINQALMRMQIFAPMYIPYFLTFFDVVLKQSARANSKGSAIKNIPPFEILKNYLVPLPPLAEQKRIVARLEELLPLCERLK